MGILQHSFLNLYAKAHGSEPIVLVILKSTCFLIHALIPRDLKARGLKSAGYEKREVGPRAVKSARYPALLGKARTFGKIVQN
jgi:hypothetical protein